MKIKLYEQFLNENQGPQILSSLEDAEGKLSGKTGIVLSGVDGDITDIEEVIKGIPHTEAYVLITKQDGHVTTWKSDVFLVGGKQDGEMSIKQYFDEEWTDPAGGVHRGDEEDPAAMYENEIRARGIIESKEALVDFMKALIRGEVAQIVSSQSNIKIILSDIGLDQVEKALDEIKTEVERLKKS